MQASAGIRKGRERLGAVGGAVWCQLRFYEEDSTATVEIGTNGAASATGTWAGEPGDRFSETASAAAVAGSTGSHSGRVGATAGATPAGEAQQDATPS